MNCVSGGACGAPGHRLGGVQPLSYKPRFATHFCGLQDTPCWTNFDGQKQLLRMLELGLLWCISIQNCIQSSEDPQVSGCRTSSLFRIIRLQKSLKLSRPSLFPSRPSHSTDFAAPICAHNMPDSSDHGTVWRELLANEATSWSSRRTLARPYAQKWQTLDGQWPRRLLHIPTMTSVEREDGDAYIGHHRPRYNILSYTWGRWEVRDADPKRERLQVAGVSWTVPAVSCFSAEEFHRAILKMSQTAQFAWIDVVCIDQENYAVKMDEIGRQAGIFSNAYSVYVWLWSLDLHSLQSHHITIIKDRMACPDPQVPGGRDLMTVLCDVKNAVECIFGDCWFSSLWTLQEAVLRQDAMLMSRDGQLLGDEVARFRTTSRPPGIPDDFEEPPSSRPGALAYLVEKVYSLYSELTAHPTRFQNAQVKVLRDEIIQRVLRTGFSFTVGSNPNVQYAAAKHRQATNETDRIYGIMAIYGIKVGATAPGANKSMVFSLAELEDEFAAALNADSPLLGQMFIHTKRPRTGRSWQITQESRFPLETLSNYNHHRAFDHCKISANTGPSPTARVSGSIIPLKSLLEHWKACGGLPPGGFTDLRLELDDWVFEDHASIPRPSELYTFRGSGEDFSDYLLGVVYRTCEALSEAFGPDRLSVLLLGTREGDPWSSTLLYGLLLLHDGQNWNSCQRLGLCLWPADPWNGVGAEKTPRSTIYNGMIR